MTLSAIFSKLFAKFFNFIKRLYVKLILFPKLRRLDVLEDIDPDFTLFYPALLEMWISLLDEKRARNPLKVPLVVFTLRPRRVKRFLLFRSNELISADLLKPFDLMVCTNGKGISVLSSRMMAYRRELWVRYTTPILDKFL